MDNAEPGTSADTEDKGYRLRIKVSISDTEDKGLSISDTLMLVSCCNAKISCTDLETKHSAKWNGGVLHVVSVQEPSLTMLKELNYNPYAGYRRV